MPVNNTILERYDPDINFMPQISCEYFSDNDLMHFTSANMGLSLLHANVRSATRNLSTLLDTLHVTNSKFSILALTETWLNQHNFSTCDILGYTHIGTCRKHTRGGGVSLHLDNNLVFKERNDLSLSHPHFESIFAEILPSIANKVPIIVGTVYRPPSSSVDAFLDTFTDVLSQLQTQTHVPCYIAGDFNLDLAQCDTNTDAQSFLDLMHSNSLIPLINKPTRTTDTTETIIDNIFCNNLSGHNSSGILLNDVSDHFPIFCSIETHQSQTPSAKSTYNFRSYNEASKQAFADRIQSENWNSVYASQDAQNAYSSFAATVSDAYLNCFPLQQKQRTKSTQNPWLTRGLKRSIKKKNKLYAILKQRPNAYNAIIYRRYKNILKRLIIVAKREYFQEQLHKHRSNINKTWQILKTAIGHNKNNPPLKSALIDGNLQTDTTLIANAINNYFVDVGSSLDALIPSSDLDPSSFLRGHHMDSLYLSPVTPDEIYTCLLKLKDSCSGHDHLKPSIIKNIAQYITQPLAHVLNLCFQQAIFPTELKQANITPIFKKGDPTLFQNYRPIAILPVFSKIFEHLLHTRLVSFFDRNNIISSSQFGFRKHYSTEQALASTMERISSELDHGNDVIGIFLDLKKAFDTVNSEILLRKLHFYGVRGIPLALIRNYLHGRTQRTVLNNYHSHQLQCSCGVPQGSILGPLLFIVYINDLSNTLSSAFTTMYADDTNIFLSGNNITHMTDILNIEMQALSSWLQCNRLSLNVDKTHVMVFSLNPTTRNLKPSIEINGSSISTINTTTFLGVKIDNSLSWKHHTTHVCNKISKSIGILKKVSHIFDRTVLQNLYNTFILPYLTYCISIWGNAANTHLNHIFILQKRALRIIYHTDALAHTTPLFSHSGILKLEDLYTYSLALIIYRLKNNMYPSTFINLFISYITPRSSNETAHLTRATSTSVVTLPRCRTTFRQKTLAYTLPQTINNLLIPLDLLSINSFNTFKRNIKVILASKY